MDAAVGLVVGDSLEGTRATPKRGSVLLVLLVLAAAGLATAGILPRMERHAERVKALARVEEGARVSVVQARPAPDQVVLTLPGGTQAIQETTLYARTSGFLARRAVDIGDRVKEGQLLAEIESPELDQELARAEAHVKEARANLALARRSLDRLATLNETKTVGDQEVDDQRVRVNTADAAAAAGEADVRRLSALQSFEKVAAPFAGTITARGVDKGALISAGSGAQVTSLFTIADTSALRVFVDVPQNAAPGVREGQEADIVVREFPSRVFKGNVVRTARALDPATRTLRTEIDLSNADGALLTGMYVQVKLAIRSDHPGVLIPARTLVLGKEGPRVAVVTTEKRVEMRSVALGRDLGTEIEVTQGLAGGERLVENPTDDLDSWQTVRVADAEPSSSGTKVAVNEK